MMFPKEKKRHLTSNMTKPVSFLPQNSFVLPFSTALCLMFLAPAIIVFSASGETLPSMLQTPHQILPLS